MADTLPLGRFCCERMEDAVRAFALSLVLRQVPISSSILGKVGTQYERDYENAIAEEIMFTPARDVGGSRGTVEHMLIAPPRQQSLTTTTSPEVVEHDATFGKLPRSPRDGGLVTTSA